MIDLDQINIFISKEQSIILTPFNCIIMSTSLHLTPERSSLLDPSKVALLQYINDRKQPLHNYQQRSIFWDRQHLYNQNLTLRNKIKELSQTNTKTKTQLLKSQKQIVDLTNSRTRITTSSIYRSTSTQQFKKDRELNTLKWRVDALKDEEHIKKVLTMKQQIIALKDELGKLRTENLELKQSIKHTRMSELQIENRQLQEELLRLRKIVSDTNRTHEQLYRTYMRQKQQISLKVRREVENRGQLVRDLKRAKEELEQARSKGKEQARSKSKELKNDWKLMMQIKSLQRENSQLKETIEVGMRTNGFKFAQSRNDLTKLQYSASALGDFYNTDRKLPILQTPLPQIKSAYPNMSSDLTSLQLLTPKVTLEEFRSPQKAASGFMPSNLISEQAPNQEMEEGNGNFTKSKQYRLEEAEQYEKQPFQKQAQQQVAQSEHKQGYQSSEYEYIMEQL